ncbi:MAG: ABC transporter ATP-binding protein [Myxococcota bacterium]
MIRVQALHKAYRLGARRVPVLAGVDLEVNEGEFVALVGQSGSGKSTLLNVLGLLDGWDRGRYSLDGRDVTELGEREAARTRNQIIGFVFQSFHLLASKTAWENVALPLAYRGKRRRECRETAASVLERLGLAACIDRRPNQLSGGQRQRVAVARALVTDPPLVLADEPTGNLDSQATREVMDLLHQAHADGRTVVMVTHEPEIAREVERTIVMRDARIVEDRQSVAEGVESKDAP